MYSKTGKKTFFYMFVTPTSQIHSPYFRNWQCLLHKHTLLPPGPSPLPSTSVMQINIASLVAFKLDSLSLFSDSTQKRAQEVSQLVILEMFPKIKARRFIVNWGERCFLLETQGPGGPNIPRSCHVPDLL